MRPDRRGKTADGPGVVVLGALAEWYCTRLESERPKGLGGSNPSRSVSALQVTGLGGFFVL